MSVNQKKRPGKAHGNVMYSLLCYVCTCPCNPFMQIVGFGLGNPLEPGRLQPVLVGWLVMDFGPGYQLGYQSGY
jgi:hypothetical protein